jgi:hypothetical protein
MKKSDFNLIQFNSDLLEFENQEPEAVSPDLSKSVKARIHREIFKDKIQAISSALLVHAIAGLLVLIICPQFNIQIIKNFAGLQHVFMIFGSHVCLFLCGAFFLAVSVGLSAFLLTSTTLRYLYSIRYYHIAGLATFTLFLFSFAKSIPLNLHTLMWFMGAFVSGSLSSKIFILKLRF